MHPHQVKDLLQSLLDVKDRMGDSSTEEIARLAFDSLLAGYETTANTLSYTIYLLAMHPGVQEKLQKEIDGYFEEDPVSIRLSLVLLQARTYHCSQVASEPPPPAIARVRKCGNVCSPQYHPKLLAQQCSACHLLPI